MLIHTPRSHTMRPNPTKMRECSDALQASHVAGLLARSMTERDLQESVRQLCRALGGSHASPKMHMRRGHVRHLEHFATWVRPHIVGAADAGVVSKDYRIAPRGSAPEG